MAHVEAVSGRHLDTVSSIIGPPRVDRRAFLFELGKDLTLSAADQQQTRTVPARQVGMWRDRLVAALFGPAQGAAA